MVHAVARCTGSKYFLFRDPGAGAPGFMLPPASRAQTMRLGVAGLTQNYNDVFDDVVYCGEDVWAALDGHANDNKQCED